MKRHFILLLVILANIQSQGQNPNITIPVTEDTLTLRCIEFIKTKTFDHNKDLYPVPCNDISILIDSLWKENTSYSISHFTFSKQDPVIRDTPLGMGQFITNDRCSPFIRYKLDKFPNGKFMLTIVQGHL